MSRRRTREEYEDVPTDADLEEEELEAGPSMGEVLRGEQPPADTDAMMDDLVSQMEQARIVDRPIVQARSRTRRTLFTDQLSDLEYLSRIRTALPNFTLQDVYNGLQENERIKQELADTTAGRIYTTMKLNNLHRALFMEPVEPGVISVHIDQLKRDGRNITLDDVASAFDAAPELEYELEGIYMYLYVDDTERFLLDLTRLRDIDLVPLTAANMLYGESADFYLPHSISIHNLDQSRVRDPSYDARTDLTYLQRIRSIMPSFELSNIYARLQRVREMENTLANTPVGRFYSYLRDAGIHLNVDAEVTSDNRVKVGTVYDQGFDGILDSERITRAAEYAGIPIDRNGKLTISGGDSAPCQFILDLEKLRDIDVAPMSAARMNFSLSDVFNGNFCDLNFDGTAMSLLFFE